MRMLFNAEENRALCGIWRQSLYQFPNKLRIFTAMAASILVYVIVIELIRTWNEKFPIVSLTAGFLSIGILIIGVILWINALFEGEHQRFRSRMAFPISRKIYLFGSFMVMIRDTVVLLMFATIFTAFEILVMKLVKIFQADLLVVNLVNLADFWNGFWISLSVIAFFYALCFCLGIYLARARIKTSIVLGILLVLFANRFIYFGIDGLFLKAIYNLVISQIPAVFYLKIWLLTIFLYLLAYLPLRKLEV